MAKGKKSAVLEEVVEISPEIKEKMADKDNPVPLTEQEDKKVTEAVIAKANDPSTQRVLTKMAREYKEYLAKSPRVQVRLDKDPKIDRPTHPVKIDGKIYESYGEPQSFNVNSYQYWVPKGVYVPVPQPIFEIIQQNEQSLLDGKKELSAKMMAGRHMEVYSND